MRIVIKNGDRMIEIYNGAEEVIEFNNISYDVKGGGDGRGIPLIKDVKPDAKLKCNCEPTIIQKDYDYQCMERTLYFARCEKHHITTWGYQTEKEALKAWKDGIVTDNYNFCEVVYE